MLVENIKSEISGIKHLDGVPASLNSLTTGKTLKFANADRADSRPIPVCGMMMPMRCIKTVNFQQLIDILEIVGIWRCPQAPYTALAWDVRPSI